jgi:hypothetical protein
MAETVSRRPLIVVARFRSLVIPCGICGEQIDTGAGFIRVLRFSPVSFIPPVLHYSEKRKKHIIIIIGLHNKPQGCGASAHLLRGPSQKKIVHFAWNYGKLKRVQFQFGLNSSERLGILLGFGICQVIFMYFGKCVRYVQSVFNIYNLLHKEREVANSSCEVVRPAVTSK